MTIKYANVPIEPPDSDGEMQAVLERYWHLHRIEEAEHPAYQTTHGIDHLPLPTAPNSDCPRLGVLHWPRGASRWSTFHALVHGDTIAAIRTAVGTTPVAASLVLSDGTTSVSPDMWMLPPRPVFQKGEKELYLLSLVDQRWFWWLHGNGKAPEDPASWSALLTSLFTLIGESPTLPSIASAYGTPDPGRWNLGYKPIPLLIDAVCNTIGLRVTRTLAGVVGVTGPQAAITADSSNWNLYRYEAIPGGRLTAADIARGLPASVAVVFPAGDAAESITVTRTLASLALSEYSGITAVPGTYAQVNADKPSTATASSQGDYATQAATDYYLWALNYTDAAFRAVVSWSPTGMESVVEWVHEPGRVLTRVIRDRFADRNVYGSAGPAGGCCQWGANDQYITSEPSVAPNPSNPLDQFSWPIFNIPGPGGFTANAYRVLENTVTVVPKDLDAVDLLASVHAVADATIPGSGLYSWLAVYAAIVWADSNGVFLPPGPDTGQILLQGGTSSPTPVLAAQQKALELYGDRGGFNGLFERVTPFGRTFKKEGTQVTFNDAATSFGTHDAVFAIAVFTRGNLVPGWGASIFFDGRERGETGTRLKWKRGESGECCDPTANEYPDPVPAPPPPPPPPGGGTPRIDPTGTPGPRLKSYVTGTAVQFAGNATGTIGNVTWRWRWGDGTADGVGPNPSHTFNVAGTFTVLVDVVDQNGSQADGSVGPFTFEVSDVASVTANYTIGDDLRVKSVRGDATGGGFSVTLPDVTKWPPSEGVYVVKTDASGNNVSATPAIGHTIAGGAAAFLLTAQNKYVRLKPGTGTDWLVDANN